MALKKKRENAIGVVTEYHKIKRILLEAQEGEEVEVVYEPTDEEKRLHSRKREYRVSPSEGYLLKLEIESYASENYRNDPEKTFADTQLVMKKLSNEEFQNLSIQQIFPLAYKLLKEEPEYQGSEDC